ncbi:MAG TPA: LysM peptidoglycan-binding domain-containing protein, partial [Pseudomonadales bacterium]|nr:LysM peptidoglycan-binding domain-containing protein [Pseudomonadales bacterium]
FISNPQEAKQLAEPAFQRKMAQAIFDGTNAYFTKRPPDGSLIAKNKKNKPTVYSVKRGDTLSKIARQHGVELQAIRQLNNLNRDTLKVDQQLLIPKS